MKTKLILIAITLVFALDANGQNFNYGISGGYDIVDIRQTPLPSYVLGPPYRKMMSYNVNCFVSYRIINNWEISIEPGYIRKGGSCGVQNRSRLELNYLQMPLVTNWYALNKFYISLGPEISYLLNAKAVNPGSSADFSSVYKRKFELSGLIGINYKITKTIDLGLRYNHSLIYILKLADYGPNMEFLNWERQYNQYWQFKISFNIKGHFNRPT